MLRSTTLVAALVAGLLTSALPAQAQTYPTRPIKFVVPFAAGSATDALARILGQKLTGAEGWTVLIENIAGASGMLAAQNVARSPADGYTVFVTSNTTHAANQSLFKKLTYDPIGDFEPVGKLGNITLALAVHPSVPATDAKELITYGKANPGKLTFGSGSSSSRLAGEMLKTLAGFDMLHVPYKSNPMAITDLLGGQISLVFADVSTTLPQIRAGKVKGLGVSSAQRSALAPDLPTMIEAGVPGYELTAWFAAFVPAKTPQPIVAKLNAALNAAMADQATQDALLAAGIEPLTSTPGELRAFVVSETKKWADIVKAAGIQPE
ncbi:MAG TPA: tripartite tricarboxylate transporter substrate binding protein [Xanthobacteraceae bacterium]|nr:tripartite tricarboxylate transporter substrate binding protein [Xanthobacteraceae bacterium]